jgi:hypothetical protein
MHVKAFVRLPKSISKAGEWKCGALHSNQRMTKTSFRLGPRRPFMLGNQWYWRVDQLKCGPYAGRLLIAYHLGKPSYIAWLAIERAPGDWAVVVCLEYHADHPGWHIHTKNAELKDFATGCTRQRISGIRIPGKRSYYRDRGYDMGPQAAVNIAYRAFRITGPSPAQEALL